MSWDKWTLTAATSKIAPLANAKITASKASGSLNARSLRNIRYNTPEFAELNVRLKPMIVRYVMLANSGFLNRLLRNTARTTWKKRPLYTDTPSVSNVIIEKKYSFRYDRMIMPRNCANASKLTNLKIVL